MPSRRVCARSLCALALAVSAGSAVASASPVAGFPPPQFSLGLSFNAQVIRFAPNEAESYSLFASPSVTGYSEESHADNSVRVTSNNGAFEGFTAGGGGFSSSAALPMFGNLYDAINDGLGWLVEIHDGATGFTHEYAFDLTAPTLTSDHMRPITFTNVQPGDIISNSPTFEWMIPASMDPMAEYQDAFPNLFGAQSYFSPPITPSDTSWSPTGPIAEGVYDLYLHFQTFTGSDLFSATSPMALSGAPDLADFSYTGFFSSFAAVSGLQVVPAVGTAAIFALGALGAGARRRR